MRPGDIAFARARSGMLSARTRTRDVHHHYAHHEREPEPADEAEVREQAPDLKPLEHGGEI